MVGLQRNSWRYKGCESCCIHNEFAFSGECAPRYANEVSICAHVDRTMLVCFIIVLCD